MKRIAAWFLALMFVLSAALAEEVELPAPPGEGAPLGAETWDDGTVYQVYAYAYEKASGAFATQLTTYSWLLGGAGLAMEETPERGEGTVMSGQTTWYAISIGGQTAYLSFETGYFARQSLLTLYVPDDMAFTLNPDRDASAPPVLANGAAFGVSTSGSSFQNDVFLVDIDAPSGSAGPVICEFCHGSGRCGTCGGDGTWRNPYTGNLMICGACDDGVCPICGGTGVWD